MYWRTLDGQVTIIDTTIKWRENLYYGLSFQTFEGSTLPPFESIESTDSKVELGDATNLQTLQEQYEDQMGKAVPARYKNDAEWIQSKLTA